MTIVDIHGRLGNSALLYTIVILVWALWRFFKKQGPDSNYWGALAVAEGLYLLLGVFGLLSWLTGVGTLSGFIHPLYGIVSVLVVPAMFLYTRANENRRTMLLFAGALLFQIGIILRGMATH
jgi:hypothetical protein